MRFWKVVVQRVAVIKLRVNNRCDNGTGSFEVKIGADTMMFTNVIITRLKDAKPNGRDIFSAKITTSKKILSACKSVDV